MCIQSNGIKLISWQKNTGEKVAKNSFWQAKKKGGESERKKKFQSKCETKWIMSKWVNSAMKQNYWPSKRFSKWEKKKYHHHQFHGMWLAEAFTNMQNWKNCWPKQNQCENLKIYCTNQNIIISFLCVFVCRRESYFYFLVAFIHINTINRVVIELSKSTEFSCFWIKQNVKYIKKKFNGFSFSALCEIEYAVVSNVIG